ncbi:MAG: hypothetical protein HY273_01030 [Gammaproteobacteria bacterium]|nr:hypothetical protein [Gammaproteobacteria bacterium]
MKVVHTKRCLAGVVLSLACVSASAESQFGLGAQLTPQDGITVYLPIKADAGILIEPFFAYRSEKSSMSTDGQDEISSKFTVREIGIGIFGSRAVSETLDMYYGARIGFINVKNTDTDYQSTPTQTVTYTGDGYVIQPTVGAAYRVTPNVSFALEVALNYTNVDTSEDSNFSSSTTDRTNTFVNTRSSFVARYMF